MRLVISPHFAYSPLLRFSLAAWEARSPRFWKALRNNLREVFMDREQRLRELYLKISYFIDAEKADGEPTPSIMAAKGEIYREWHSLDRGGNYVPTRI